MASASSINSNSSGSQAPNPPPRTHSTHSRPTQPPPPPPLPSVPPVPPTRDSSINIMPLEARTTVSQTNSPTGSSVFLSDLVNLFKPIQDLPTPEPYMNKHKSYPSQKSHKQSIAPKVDT